MRPDSTVEPVLLVHPRPRAYESIPGYALELSSRNGFDRPSRLIRELAPPDQNIQGKSIALYLMTRSELHKALSGAAGLTEDETQNLRFPMELKKKDGVHARDGTSTYPIEYRTRFECPVCLQQGQPHRNTWLVRDTICCSLHEIMLTGHCGNCGRPISWESPNRRYCPHCQSDYALNPQVAVGRRVVELAKYLESRCKPNPAANEKTDLSKAIGDIRNVLSDLAATLWSRGFCSLDATEMAMRIQETALRLYPGEQPDSVKATRAWKRRTTDYAIACRERYPDVPVEIFLTRLQVPFQNWLGRPLPGHHLGLERPRTMSFTDPLVHVDSFVSARVVAEAFNLTPHNLQGLHEAGLLPEPKQHYGPFPETTSRPALSLDDVGTFYRNLAIEHLPPTVEASTVSLSQAVAVFRQLSPGKLLKLVTWKRLKPEAWDRKRGLAGLQFKWSDIRDVAETRFQGKASQHAARILGISTRGYEALVSAGLVRRFARDLRGGIAHNPNSNPPDSLVSLPQLGLWLEDDPIILRHNFEAEGLQPHALPDDLPGFTYWWNDVTSTETFVQHATGLTPGVFLRQQIAVPRSNPKILPLRTAAAYLELPEDDVLQLLHEGWIPRPIGNESWNPHVHRADLLHAIDVNFRQVKTVAVETAALHMEESPQRFRARWIESGRAHALPPRYSHVLAADFNSNVRPFKYTLTPREAAEITGATVGEVRTLIRKGLVRPVSGPSVDAWPNYLIPVQDFLTFCISYGRTPTPRKGKGIGDEAPT